MSLAPLFKLSFLNRAQRHVQEDVTTLSLEQLSTGQCLSSPASRSVWKSGVGLSSPTKGCAMKALPLLLLPLAITACATPESRLRTGLVEAGLSKKQSGCMAGQMADKLSLGQMMKLSSLRKLKEDSVKDMSVRQFLRNVRALEDPEILSITSKAAVGCALFG